MGSHEKAIIKCKQRLQLKDSAKKVLSAIRNRSTNSVTGKEMALLIESIQSNDLFKNKVSVRNAINQRNEVINALISKLNSVISDLKQSETGLPQPSQIPISDLIKLIATVDNANSSAAIIDS